MFDCLLGIFQQYGLPLMFSSAFLSATILPGNSEVVFIALAASLNLSFHHCCSPEVLSLLLVATLGNSLGSFTSYGIGYLFPKWKSENSKITWAMTQFSRYGNLMLLLSWLPVLGDVLCVAAGWQRLNWLRSLIYISIGKLLRYVFLLFLVMSYSFL